MDYFEETIKKIDNNLEFDILKFNIEKFTKSRNYEFNLFNNVISEDVKKIYNTYSSFLLSWENSIHRDCGYIDFISYENIVLWHDTLCNDIADFENDMIDEQKKVENDIIHWYPVFKFPNGDMFCFDDRYGNIVFYEHDVFDCGINLHGLVIAQSIDDLFQKWSEVLFVDIYDWFEGVDENGIDVSKDIYKFIKDS